MHTDNVNFLSCAINQTFHGVSAFITNFWTFLGPNVPFLGLEMGVKTSKSSTHVYLQVSFSMFYSTSIPSWSSN